MSSISPSALNPLFNPPPGKNVAPAKVIRVDRPHVGDGGDSFIEWGRASHFTAISNGAKTQPTESGGVVSVPMQPLDDNGNPAPSPDDPVPHQPTSQVYHWSEKGRSQVVRRIQNPVDSGQFVNVQIAKSILMVAPDGTYHQFDYATDVDDGSGLGGDGGGFGNSLF